jgi:dipeptidase
LLAAGRGRLTTAEMRAVLRDHYAGGVVHHPRAVDDPEFFSLCMHADPLDNTTAAMVTPLRPRTAPPTAAWFCLGSPCVGVFLPCYVEGRLPRLGSRGRADAASPWWQMRALSLVERDFAGSCQARMWDALEELARGGGRQGSRCPPPCQERRCVTLSGVMERATRLWLARSGNRPGDRGG